MPRYLHIPHTPDTARTLTLSGRNCLAVGGMVTPPLKSATGAKKGAEAKCVRKARRSPTAGLLRALSRICASMRPTSRSLHIGKPSMYPTSRSLHVGMPSMYPTSRSLLMGMPSMCPTSRSLHVGMPSMCPTSRSLHMGKPRDVPYRELPSAAPENLPVATKMANEVICLPMHQDLSEEDIERVIMEVNSE